MFAFVQPVFYHRLLPICSLKLKRGISGILHLTSKNLYNARSLALDQRFSCKCASKVPHKMAKSALVILAAGAEEMETVITADVLRRAGVQVTVAGLDGADPVLCSRLVTLVPDKSLEQALSEQSQYDAVILPGGLEGSDRLGKSAKVGAVLSEHEKAGKIVAAICAAPTAFVTHGIARGKRVTSYPTTKDKVAGGEGNYQYVEGEQVVVDGNVVTSRGPGTAFAFGLKLAELLAGKDKSQQVEKGMILSGY